MTEKRKKSWRCRLGFHLVYADTVGQNLGSEERPVIMMTTTYRCNDCDWSSEVL